MTQTARQITECAIPAAAAGIGPMQPARAPGTPFRSAEEAWFWTMAALAARHAGARSGGRGPVRPCAPDDVVKCLDTLYRRGRITLAHARILRIWGDRGICPDARFPAERTEARLWQDALARLEWLLRVKSIVA